MEIEKIEKVKQAIYSQVKLTDEFKKFITKSERTQVLLDRIRKIVETSFEDFSFEDDDIVNEIYNLCKSDCIFCYRTQSTVTSDICSKRKCTYFWQGAYVNFPAYHCNVCKSLSQNICTHTMIHIKCAECEKINVGICFICNSKRTTLCSICECKLKFVCENCSSDSQCFNKCQEC